MIGIVVFVKRVHSEHPRRKAKEEVELHPRILTTNDDTPAPDIPIQVDQALNYEGNRRLWFDEAGERNSNKRPKKPTTKTDTMK